MNRWNRTRERRFLILAEKKQDGTLFEVPGDPFENFASTFENESGKFLAWKVPEEGGDRLVELHGDVRFTTSYFLISLGILC